MPTLVLGQTITTARIPELTAHGDPITLDDEIALYVTALNKTRHATIAQLKTAILNSSGQTYPPIYYAGELLYIVPDDIEPGVTTMTNSDLAGKSFSLKRGGIPLIPQTDPERPDAEYEILETGGFSLLQDGDELRPGERYELYIFSLVGASQGGTSGGGAGTNNFFDGDFEITTDLTLNSSHFNKLLQLRSISPLSITLPSVVDVPDNQILVFETTINHVTESRIATSGGQYILGQGQSRNWIYMRLGETLWLKRTDSGWYVINDFMKIYDGLGQITALYKAGHNQLECSGQQVSRASYPRLWDWVQSLGYALVDEAIWQTASVSMGGGRTVAYPYRGCFSKGDNSTTFRLPDLRGLFLRGIKSGDDRYYNHEGGYQDDMIRQHIHDGQIQTGGSNNTDPVAAYKKSNLSDGWGSTSLVSILPTGGTDTRPENAAVKWVINC